MNKIIKSPACTSLFAVVTAAALTSVFMASAEAQPQQDVIIAYNLPEHHATGTYFEVLAEEIAERTESTSVQLIPRTFPDGQLYNDQQLPDAISTGAAHIGQINLGFMAGPNAEPLRIWALPLLYETWEAEWAAEDSPAFREVFQKQLLTYDQTLLGWPAYGTVEIYTNEPFRTPDDVKGLRVRSFGLDTTEFLHNIGASPVSMSSQEIYQAMQRGTIDGYVTGPSSVLSRSLHEVSKYGTNIALNRIPFIASANTSWWNGLPEDVQSAIREASAVAQKASRSQAKKDAAAELEELRELGMEIHDPTAEELALWSEAAVSRQKAYAETVGEQAKEMLEAVEKANEEYPSN
jgi:TRAP-type C4-dicarboxylate transport system substrate-binding protein